MNQDGKIFVVVAGLLIIFVVLCIYLIKLDQRIGKLEKQKKEQ